MRKENHRDHYIPRQRQPEATEHRTPAHDQPAVRLTLRLAEELLTGAALGIGAVLGAAGGLTMITWLL